MAKGNGNVASLPKKRHFTPQEKIQIVNRIDAARAGGMGIIGAAKQAGVGVTQYYIWRKALDGKLNDNVGPPYIPPPSIPGVRITLTIAGEPVQVSLEDARSIQAGLNDLLR